MGNFVRGRVSRNLQVLQVGLLFHEYLFAFVEKTDKNSLQRVREKGGSRRDLSKTNLALLLVRL